MRRGLLLAGISVIAAAIVRSRLPTVYEPPAVRHSHAEISPVCPWRDPPRDLATLFPGATGYATESPILNAMTAPIRKQLSRSMASDENPLRVFRVQRGNENAGSVLVCRVKGEHGGIELIIGVETNGVVRAVTLQSQREPDAVARAITNPAWLSSFAGKDSNSRFRLGEDLPEVPADARASAEAIAEGVRSQIVVLSFAGKIAGSRVADPHAGHHH